MPTAVLTGTITANTGAGNAWSGTPTLPVSAGTAGTNQDLVITGFGGAIPAGSVIDGIEIVFTEAKSGLFVAPDEPLFISAQLYLGGVVGTAKTVNAVWATSPTRTLGNSSDKWGASPSIAMINDPGFGVLVSSSFPVAGPGTSMTLSVVQITVTYSTASGGEQPLSGPTASQRILTTSVL